MLQQFNLSNFIGQAIRCVKIMGESYDFFKTNKLWEGIFRHKWILFLTIILSTLFTLALFSDLYDLIFSSPSIPDVIIEGGIDGQDSDVTKSRNKNTAIFGGSKFLLMILLEIVIFYFSVKTLEILNNEEYKTSFGMFLAAEIRMIKVIVRGFIYALLVQIALSIVLSILDFDFLLPILMFIVHAYFIGYSFFDNYNEQQKLNIKESDLCIRHNSGAATALGIAASLGLLIPFVGALVVPVLGAISANIYGFRYNIENPAHHTASKNQPQEQEEEFI